MKLITFAVPAYNSQDYLHICVNSLLLAGPDAEIIIIDDGSTDNTAEIADSFAAKYPEVVRVFHQQNKGHGGALNTAIQNASGIYFKTVDSDDWLDENAVPSYMEKLRELEADGGADMVVCNYSYYIKGKGVRQVISYHNVFPRGKIIGWENTGKFTPFQFLTHHSVTFRLSVVRESGVLLPEHVFYEDNVYLYAPLPLCKKLVYFDLDLYMYLIGREGQSVSRENSGKKCRDQCLVAELDLAMYDLGKIRETNPRLCRFMYQFLRMLTLGGIMYTRVGKADGSCRDVRFMWENMNSCGMNKDYIRRMKLISTPISIPGKFGRFIAVGPLYAIARRKVNFS